MITVWENSSAGGRLSALYGGQRVIEADAFYTTVES